MSKDESENQPIGAQETVGKRLTPLDIQEKMFRRAFKGYDEREVDAFLDEVTEEMARMHAENKALREQLDQTGAGSFRLASSGDPAVTAAAFVPAPDALPLRELTSGFISRERTFLQSLAGIIQQHAEAVKEDVRRARDVMEPRSAPSAPPSAIPDAPVATPATETVALEGGSPFTAGGEDLGVAEESLTVVAPSSMGASASAVGAVAEGGSTARMVDISEIERAPSSPAGGPGSLRAGPAPQEGEADGRENLRELFWGEE